MSYCWTSLAIVIAVGLAISLSSWYIKKLFHLTSESVVITMGLLYLCTLLLAKTVMQSMESQPCFTTSGFDLWAVMVMVATLVFAKLVLANATAIPIGGNGLSLDTTVLLMMLAYVALFVLWPPMKNGEHGPWFPWVEKSVQRLRNNLKSPNQGLSVVNNINTTRQPTA